MKDQKRRPVIAVDYGQSNIPETKPHGPIPTGVDLSHFAGVRPAGLHSGNTRTTEAYVGEAAEEP